MSMDHKPSTGCCIEPNVILETLVLVGKMKSMIQKMTVEKMESVSEDVVSLVPPLNIKPQPLQNGNPLSPLSVTTFLKHPVPFLT